MRNPAEIEELKEGSPVTKLVELKEFTFFFWRDRAVVFFKNAYLFS